MKRGTPDHPKMYDLSRRLKIPIYAANGIMERIWHFTSKYAIQGDIGRWDNAAIAKAAGWTKSPAVLVDALVDSGWLDKSQDSILIVHDWADHLDESVKKTLRNRGIEVIKPNQQVMPLFSGNVLEKSRTGEPGRTETVGPSLSHSHSHSHSHSLSVAVAASSASSNGTEKTPSPPAPGDEFDGGEAFMEFWAAWPKHKQQRRPVCATLYADRLMPLLPVDQRELHARIIAPLLPRGKLRESRRWTEQGGKYLPSPEDYLRNERWDEDWSDGSGNEVDDMIARLRHGNA